MPTHTSTRLAFRTSGSFLEIVNPFMDSSTFWSCYWGTHVAAIAGLAMANSAASAGLFPAVVTKLVEELSRYGKTLSTHSRFLSVPKRRFVDFYVIGTFVNTLVLCSKNGSMLWLYQIQVLRRLVESLFVTRFSSTAQMHVLHYILGISYYIAVPLTLYCIGDHSDFLKTRHCCFSVSIFLAANWIQYVCHKNLAELRPFRAPAEKGVGYSMPRGYWFDFVSCPHYTAEVTIYTALAVMARGARPVIFLAVFVAIELSLSATTQHQWYRQKFREYPRHRRAIFPFIL